MPILNKAVMKEYIEYISCNNLEAAQNLLLNNVSKEQMIYKYCRGLERDLDNLKKEKIWLSNAFNFNDPYDCLVTVDCGLKEKYSKVQVKEAMEIYTRQIEENKKTERLQNSIFVSCFSEINNSFPLWGYYAADHKGICIGYNLQELIKKYQCMPVIYSAELIVKQEGCSADQFMANALTKSEEWKHECEWRIVKKDENNVGMRGIEIDFIKPKEIYIGCKKMKMEKDLMTEKNEAEQYATIDDLADYADKNYIDIYLSLISQKEYKLIDKALTLNA